MIWEKNREDVSAFFSFYYGYCSQPPLDSSDDEAGFSYVVSWVSTWHALGIYSAGDDDIDFLVCF